jgi:ketosteroid isomerase-like protein
MATRRPKPRKRGSRRSAGKAGKAKSKRAPDKRATKAAPRAAKAKPAPGSALLAFARRIVRATQDPALFDLRDLYAEGCVSREATGDVATGLAALEAKLARWESMQEHTDWKPRKIFTDGDTICIEWDATVRMRDGRVVPLAEVAVHEVRNGKIVSERFYYNPLALAPQGPA